MPELLRFSTFSHVLFLTSIFGKCWVCFATLDQFLLTSFAGFGKKKEAKTLWQCAIYGTAWCN